MANKGTSDGHKPPNRGRGCGVSQRGQPTINSPTSINHISMLESTIPVHQHVILPTFEEEPQSIEIHDIVVTPSTLQDSFTPEDPSPHYEHVVDQRPLLQGLKFVTYGSESLRKSIGRTHHKSKLLEPFFEQKGSCIYKNAMNKIRNTHNRVT
ncbi:hypothetical protein CR513_56111, partial [Mucuna pruriens]